MQTNNSKIILYILLMAKFNIFIVFFIWGHLLFMAGDEGFPLQVVT